MKLDTMLAKAKNSKDVKNEFLDEMLTFVPEACRHEAVGVIQCAIRTFKNCASYLSAWFAADGEGITDSKGNVIGERIFFGSEIRRPKKENGLNNHDRTFASVVFLDEPPTYEHVGRIDRSPHDLMYEHARRFQVETSDFLFTVLGLIQGIQDKEYTFFDITEQDSGELILIFHSKTNHYKCAVMMLNFKTLQMDHDLLEAFGADEDNVYRPSKDDDDCTGPHRTTYLH